MINKTAIYFDTSIPAKPTQMKILESIVVTFLTVVVEEFEWAIDHGSSPHKHIAAW